MADAGAIGENGLRVDGTLLGVQTALFSGIHLGDAADPLMAFVAANTAQGNPTQPSQEQPRAGILKDIFWRVVAGLNTLTIDCKYTGAAPRLIVKQDPIRGIMADTLYAAPSGDGWVTITVTLVIPTAGVVNVWRERTEKDIGKVLYWDNLLT